jgi:hypothetical protein
LLIAQSSNALTYDFFPFVSGTLEACSDNHPAGFTAELVHRESRPFVKSATDEKCLEGVRTQRAVAQMTQFWRDKCL